MAKRALIGIGKFFGSILIFILVGYLSYRLSLFFFQETGGVERSTQYQHVMEINTGNESSNLIYSYDEKTQEIKAMVLELFDMGTKNMTYITIPVNTAVTLSDKTFQEYRKINPNIPRSFCMKDLNKYFDGDVAYEYGILILQEDLPVDIGYFTAFTSTEFDKLFERKVKSTELYQPTKELLDEADKCTDKSDMNSFIEDKWDILISNITLSMKQHYSEALTNVNRDRIYLYKAYGTKDGDVYQLKRKKNRRLVNKIWEAVAYMTPQTQTQVDADSHSAAGRTIHVTNSTTINGLAARYMEKLKADGLQVIGTGNYGGEQQTSTIIYANNTKWAEDLKQYFKNPTVKQGDNLQGNAEIEIILGTEDDLAE